MKKLYLSLFVMFFTLSMSSPSFSWYYEIYGKKCFASGGSSEGAYDTEEAALEACEKEIGIVHIDKIDPIRVDPKPVSPRRTPSREMSPAPRTPSRTE